jgi:hypothetical protein
MWRVLPVGPTFGPGLARFQIQAHIPSTSGVAGPGPTHGDILNNDSLLRRV